MPAARCCFQTASQFWKSDPLGELDGLNMIGTDTMAGRIWNLSPLQPNPSTGMLASYMFDVEALQFTSLDPQHRIEALSSLLAEILPGLEGQVLAVQQKAWHEDPWAGGGWCWAPPGTMKWMYQAMRRSEGRVHFAGEHTSVWIAWMNGALESADRVVREILQRSPAG
jgi:monoamine oxidase